MIFFEFPCRLIASRRGSFNERSASRGRWRALLAERGKWAAFKPVHRSR
jgi:hypothetical protein